MDTRLLEAVEDEDADLSELLVCGPAGTGKTYGILSVLHVIARQVPNLRILFVRNTRAALTESVLQMFEEQILPSDSYDWILGRGDRTHRSYIRYPNGTRIVLGGIDNWERWKSTAWDIVFVNEATELSLASWEGIASRLNRPGVDTRFGWLIGDTNPADPMHPLKRRCDQGLCTLWDTGHEANPRLYDEDAGGWTEEGELYLGRLDRLTGTAYQRLRLGLWAAGEGAWFASYDDARDVHPTADYIPGAGPVDLAVDCNGKHVGAVWYQIRGGDAAHVCVFGDYYCEAPTRGARGHAAAILELSRKLCGHAVSRTWGDPSGGAHTGVDTTVVAEYEKAGLPLRNWPKFPGSVKSGLNLVETFLGGNLHVHPRCTATRTALLNFRRKYHKGSGQWLDEPEDPQHPHEDVVEALRGGLLGRWPDGRRQDLRLGSIRGQYLP